MHYKLLAKWLVNHLSSAIDDLVSIDQSAFVKGGKILDGPLIINEIIQWYKKRTKKTLLFNIDFEKLMIP